MLVLYHPALPFITEGIWQNRHQKNESLALQPYPEFTTVDTSHTHTFDEIKDVISNIRRIRSELNIPPAKQLKLYTVQDQLQILDQHETLVCKIAGIEAISKQAPSTTACAFISQHTQAAIELDGLVNPNDEIIRLNKKRAKQENELNKLQRKVSQPHYQEKAPKTLQERDSQEISRIKSQIQLTDTYLQLLHKM
jgi:valyl-tRNA synthetase